MHKSSSLKTLIKNLGMVVVIAAMVGLVWHRFSYPDLTAVRWFIEYWHIWLLWFTLTIIGCVLYLFGTGQND